MKLLKSIDELYSEVRDYDLVITNDAALETALNARVDTVRMGPFAITPRHLAGLLSHGILNRTEVNDLELVAKVSEETAQEAAPAGDIKPVETTIDSPAKLGDWVETKRYSAEDSQYHTVYYRITDIVRGAQDEVDAYNASDSFVKLENLDNDDLEYCMLTYEVYFPEDFPQADYGITSVDMDFGIENPDGGGIEKDGVAYIGLSSVWDISEAPEINEFYAGDTFTEGKAIFAMVKDVSGYVVESSYPDENDEMVYSYVEGK